MRPRFLQRNQGTGASSVRTTGECHGPRTAIIALAASAALLARRDVAPNTISCASVAFAALAGVAFLALRFAPSPYAQAALFLVAIGGIQGRLVCNLLDGMVAIEGGRNYIYTRQQDGSSRKKLLEKETLDLNSVSPDGRWIMVHQKDDTDKDHPDRKLAYPNDGGRPVVVEGVEVERAEKVETVEAMREGYSREKRLIIHTRVMPLVAMLLVLLRWV